ncbi:MAG: ribosome maturation factor RimM [Gemmatimonadetes bacterium]|nr:ribosome maturation factor RimM [Gemmatimonadota bacterium]
MPDRAAPAHLVVGFVSKPHGIRGEVFVQSLTDHPGGAFAPGVVLCIAGADGREPATDAAPLRVEAARPQKRGFLVRFAGMQDRNDAEELRGLYLLRAIEDLEPLDEDEVFYHDLLGLAVETVSGEPVGEVHEVFEQAPHDLLEVRTPRGILLIPFVRTVVVGVDLPARRLVVDPPEGLLEL